MPNLINHKENIYSELLNLFLRLIGQLILSSEMLKRELSGIENELNDAGATGMLKSPYVSF